MFLALVDRFRAELDSPAFPAQFISMFLVVAGSDEPLGILEVGKRAGMSSASSSRGLTILGRGLKGEVGLELIEAYENPENRSSKLLRLTDKGARLIASLEAEAAPFVSALHPK